MKRDIKRPVPRAMQTQLARLFGDESRAARLEVSTAGELRKTLRAVLKELDRYIAANVDTDEVHRSMLLSGLAAADLSLDDEDFWPSYAEGVTRLALILLGDYPDHRKHKAGRKKTEHYKLNASRSAQWIQTPEQRFRTLFAAGQNALVELSTSPREALRVFRRECGPQADHSDFMEWYRKHYPTDYVLLFR